MENKSDQAIREKLKQWQLPYDEQAWEKMEQLLDQKKDKKIFFLWWIYGTAVMLMLTVASYWLYNQGSNKSASTDEREETAKQKIWVAHGPLSHEEKEGKNNLDAQRAASNSFNQQTQLSIAEIYEETEGAALKTGIIQKKISAASTTINTSEKHSPPKPAVVHDNHRANTHQIPHSTSYVSPNKESLLLHEGSDKLLGSGLYQYSHKLQVQAQSLTDETAAVSDTVVGQTENTAISVWHQPSVSGEVANDTISAENNDKSSVSRLQRKKFLYSIGIITSLSAPVGDVYSSRPSFFAGITNDFHIGKRFAVTAGITYANTFFTKAKPRSEHYTVPPAAYSSSIREVMMPMGLKIYPFTSSKLNTYLNVGIMHHIKLKETFSYLKPPHSPLPTNPPVSPSPLVLDDYPTQTNFNAPDEGYEALGNNPGVGQPLGIRKISTADFSIHKANRYYTSAVVGLGGEYLWNDRWVIFVETLYSFTIQEIGVQEKRKNNVGGIAGMRIQF